MRTFLHCLCWFLLVAGCTCVALILAFQRNMTHALWALPIDLTMILCGFLGLMILHLLPPAKRVYALGVERGIRIGMGVEPDPSRAERVMEPRTDLRLVR